MKISVIIPTYNRAKHLKRSIESVLDQSYKADEVIIIDDGSTDETKELISHYPVKYFFQTNKGVSNSRNKGIELSSNKWLCFLDSDDIWEKEKLKKQVNFHKENPNILFSHTDEKWIFNDKQIKKKAYQKKHDRSHFLDHIENTFIGASTVMLHKDILDKIGDFKEKQIFDESLVACEDYDLWLRILREHQLGFIDEELIQKIAGHPHQLSFETPLQDKYRIEALLKHLDSAYKKEIIQEIEKRLKILRSGAKKHQNKEVLSYCKKVMDSISTNLKH